jgi:hypothetical protein
MKYTREMKIGFWSPHSKESVVQKLGAIEKEAPELLDAVCARCLQPAERPCGDCPVVRLRALIR